MRKRNKNLIILSITTIILLIALGVTYAVYQMSITGSNQELIVGDIYMKYTETNQITLDNTMPIKGNGYTVNPVMASQTYEEDTRNELSQCVDHFSSSNFRDGEDAESYCKGTGTRYGRTFQKQIDDNYFYSDELTYLKSKNIILSNLESLPYFEFKITGKNTYEKKDIWYEIVLSHGDSHATRTTRIRDDLLRFTLVEIKDGQETIIRNGFGAYDLSSKRIYVNTIEKNTTSEVDITYRLYMWIDYNTVIGNVDEDYTIDEWNDVYASIKVNVTGDFNEKELPSTDESCFTTKTKTDYVVNDVMKTQTYTSGGTNELSQCVDYFSDWYFDKGSTAESFCKGTGTIYYDYQYHYTFQQYLDQIYSSEFTKLESKNIIINQGEVIVITDYDSFCGSDVIIPKTINNLKVAVIAYEAFRGKNLISVEFEENSTLKLIGEYAFYSNPQLSEVFIPESVMYLSCIAFNNGVVVHKSDSLVCIHEHWPQ